MNITEQIERLAKLRDDGVLTEAEFQSQKSALLAGGSAATQTVAKPYRRFAKVGCAAVAGVLVVILLIGMIAAPSSDGPKPAGTASDTATPPMSVTSVALGKAYEDNEAAAQATYGNKRLAVTGRIEGIQLGIGDAPSVLLAGSNPFVHVQAALAESSQSKAAGLKKGKQITVTCESVSEVVSVPMLSECEI